jgi:hypothetical protein
MKPARRRLDRCFRESLSTFLGNKRRITLWTVLLLLVFPGSAAVSQEKGTLTLDQAVMCEDIKENAPVNKTVIFPLSLGKAICFTSFSVVPENVIMHHNWYNRDKIVARVNLRLKPPRWSTFSSIPLKEKDKGPWRVEVLDSEGRLLRVLRFSVTD